MKSYSSRELLKALKADGWQQVGAGGSSHYQFRHPTKPGRVTVPHPVKDMSPGTLRSVFRQAGWNWK
jgi:predicted RNA binding protein YcfA (HicA-like mRNA interferase family)